MKMVLKIALAQIAIILGNKKENLSRIKKACLQAAASGADIICFPELATTGYLPDVLGCELWTLSEALHGETDQLLTELSTTLNLKIICGFVERGAALGEIFNSAGVWIPGKESWQGTYRKIHLIDSEKNWFTAGSAIPVFDTPECRIGIMICHDAGYPELARILTLSGCDLLFMPAAWSIDYQDLWNINCSSRALENSIHLIAVNHHGKTGGFDFFGGSQLTDPRGQCLISASQEKEQLIFGHVDFNQQAKIRLELPYLRGRREDIYQRYLPRLKRYFFTR